MELKGHLLYYPEGKHDINLNNYVQKSQLNDAIKSKVDSITKTTYADLKNLRDNSQLVPGNLYRITDYQCTTSQNNTRSAGHQFDIVLLALSENKLAEEGWAMEHPTDVYDVTFADGVTKKCYLNVTSKFTDEAATYENWNVVDVNTMLGVQLDDVVRGVQAIVDDNTKTIVFSSINSSSLIEENLPYNYFQNSNLSAWKVWYCLDNDTSRFAWASNVEQLIDVNSMFSEGSPLTRYPDWDGTYDSEYQYAWASQADIDDDDPADALYSKTLSVQPGDKLYRGSDDVILTTNIGSITGHGVIYRLIDEWNNDCPYDFKNIQFIRKLNDGDYDGNSGEDTWCYTFNLYVTSENEYLDASLNKIIVNDENIAGSCDKNTINYALTGYNDITDGTNRRIINDIVFLAVAEENDVTYRITNNKVLQGCYVTICNNVVSNTIFLYANGIYNTWLGSNIIFGTKKFIFEDIT